MGDTDDDWLYRGTTDATEVASRYDAWAARYDDDLASWSYEAPAVVAGEVVGRRPGAGSVLDLGCGTGLVGRALRGLGFGGTLTGLDVSADSLRLARDAGGYDTLVTADLQQPLDLAGASFDAVVCVGVLTYLPDFEAACREMARVTRRGGVVAFTQREDLWADRDGRAVVQRLADDGTWTLLDVRGPAPYLPGSDGPMADLGCYYVVAQAR